MDGWVVLIGMRSEKSKTLVCFCQCSACMCTCMHLYTYVCVSDVWAIGLLETDSLSVGSRNIFTSDDPLDLFSKCLLPSSYSLHSSPIRHVNGSYHLPFSSAKKKKSRLASPLISACHLMRSLLFIFLFVRREGGETYK